MAELKGCCKLWVKCGGINAAANNVFGNRRCRDCPDGHHVSCRSLLGTVACGCRGHDLHLNDNDDQLNHNDVIFNIYFDVNDQLNHNINDALAARRRFLS